MTRVPDWPERLLAYIEGRERQPFTWGRYAQDCCSFAAGGVAAQTGEDVMADLPDYASAEEADLILAAALEDLIDARLPRTPAGIAQRGDVGIATLNRQDTVMIVEGATLVGPGARGLVRVPRRLLRVAWKV